MSHVQEMLLTHPNRTAAPQEKFVDCVEILQDCSQVCTSCADACLGEKNVYQLTRCIRLNLDCAGVCDTTVRMLERLTEPDWSVARKLVEACIAACRACGDECHRHAEMHEHCRVCADVCRTCEACCSSLLEAVI